MIKAFITTKHICVFNFLMSNAKKLLAIASVLFILYKTLQKLSSKVQKYDISSHYNSKHILFYFGENNMNKKIKKHDK